MNQGESFAGKAHMQFHFIEMTTPDFEPRTRLLLYTLLFPLILGIYVTSRKIIFVLMKIFSKNQAIQYTQQKISKRDLNKILHLKSKETMPLIIVPSLQLVGQILDLFFE